MPLAVYAALHLGLRHIHGPLDRDAALATLPAVPAHMTTFRVYLPLVVVVALMLVVRVFPHVIPPLGIPLMFLAGGAVAFAAAGARVNLVQVARDTFRETLEVNAILITVGSLVQVMAANGVRGLFVISSISVPVYVLYAAIFVVCVFLGGVLGPFAVASVFGIPFMLALLGRDPIMATVALSLLACVSSVTPPDGDPRQERHDPGRLPRLVLVISARVGRPDAGHRDRRHRGRDLRERPRRAALRLVSGEDDDDSGGLPTLVRRHGGAGGVEPPR